MKVTPELVIRILDRIDWYGHVELGENDKRWLANQISLNLSPTKGKHVCESCGTAHEIVIQTRLGRICEDCISEASETAERVREELEG